MIDRKALEEFVAGDYTSPQAKAIWESYLSKYLGKANWPEQLVSLKSQVKRKNGTQEDFYNQIAAAILMPAINRSIRVEPDNPQRFLFGCAAGGFRTEFLTEYKQFKKESWIEVLRDIVNDDVRNIQVRDEAINLGFIEKVEYQPMTRQALRWLKEKAAESGIELTINNEGKYKELVQFYGGALICNIFTRHESRVKEVLNWRTPYFFERLIHRVYTPEQIFNIKRKELDENPRLVAKVESF